MNRAQKQDAAVAARRRTAEATATRSRQVEGARGAASRQGARSAEVMRACRWEGTQRRKRKIYARSSGVAGRRRMTRGEGVRHTCALRKDVVTAHVYGGKIPAVGWRYTGSGEEVTAVVTCRMVKWRRKTAPYAQHANAPVWQRIQLCLLVSKMRWRPARIGVARCPPKNVHRAVTQQNRAGTPCPALR